MGEELEKCPKCGYAEVYITKDGKTVMCYECGHKWKGSWVKGNEE